MEQTKYSKATVLSSRGYTLQPPDGQDAVAGQPEERIWNWIRREAYASWSVQSRPNYVDLLSDGRREKATENANDSLLRTTEK